MNARAVPYYRQIADTLRARIKDGVYEVGQCIPSALELEKSFGVSNITIRKALNLLREDDWIETQQGIGSVVKQNEGVEVLDIRFSGKFTEWLEWASGKSHSIKQEVLGIDSLRGSLHIRNLLEMTDDEPLWCLCRLRSIDGEPISYHVNYALQGRLDKIRESDLEGGGSFFEVMHKRYPGTVARIEQFVEADVALMDMAEVLHINFGDPIFWVEHRYITHDDEVVAVAHLFLRADRYRYSNTISIEDLDQISSKMD